MKAELRLQYYPDNEWTGRLEAIVSSGPFSGTGSAWFNTQDLRDTFVKALREFPISRSNPPEISGGFWSKEHRGSLDQCHLQIAIRPQNVRGDLLVQVDLSTESQTNADMDEQQSVTVRFLTEYTALDAFTSELVQMLDGECDSAVLAGMTK